MVDAMTIDTLGYVKKLEAAGMDRWLAEAHAEALNDRVLPTLATKQDIRDFESKIENMGYKFENLLWKHTVAVTFSVLTIGGFLMRFVK